MKIDPTTMEKIMDEVRDLAEEYLPELVAAMVKAKSDTKAVGKLALTVEIVDDPGKQGGGRSCDLTVSAKMSTPVVSCDLHKWEYRDGQMRLL